jgi:D-hexose-6-phosphate mutarotase
MEDMTPENWRRMACIETVNASDNAVTIASGETHTMEAHITVEKLS